MAVNTHLKKDRNWGSRGGLAPLGCLPLWGREGVILAIALSALREGFLQSPKKVIRYHPQRTLGAMGDMALSINFIIQFLLISFPTKKRNSPKTKKNDYARQQGTGFF